MARLKGEFSLYKRTNSKNKVTYYAKIHSDNPAEPVKKIWVKTLSCGMVVASTDLLSIEIIMVFFPSKGPVGNTKALGCKKGRHSNML